MDAKTLTRYKKLLLEEKERIMNNSKNTLENDLSISSDDLPDEADLASTEISQNMVFKLRDRERLLLSKIHSALGRIEDGSFGLCEVCEEDIETRRLDARPVSTMCIACKEMQERREKVYA